MEFVYNNQGTCARQTIIDLADDGTINDIKIIGGCDGNLKGLSAILKGASAQEVINRFEGITCGFKKTSCPDQIAQALKKALEEV